jgi:alpha-tubulin suppressor-like RCC1 family protein
MKAFIDKIFKAKKQKELLDDIVNTKVIEENKEILSKQIETSIKKHIEKTEEVKEDIKKETKVEVQHNLKSRYKG